MNSYQILLDKLEHFIKKYYTNAIVKGLAILILLAISYLIVIYILEINFYLTPLLKIIAMSVFLILVAGVGVKYIILPLLELTKLRKRMTTYQAATIIGQHFTHISDKLLNILQLSNTSAFASQELALASIDQKAEAITPIPFVKAIDYSKTKKLLPYVIGVLLIVLLAFLFFPQKIKSASARLLQPTQFFAPPAPFEFVIDPATLQVEQFADLPLNVTLEGDKIPEHAYLIIDGEKIPMTSDGSQSFSYTIKHIAEPKFFQIEAGGFVSNIFQIAIAHIPVMDFVQMEIIYPKHIQKSSEKYAALQDVVVPYGSTIKYRFKSQHVDSISINENDAAATQDLDYVYQAVADTQFLFSFNNHSSKKNIQLQSQIKILDDLAPNIKVDRVLDAIDPMQVLLTGVATDDYGLSKLQLVVNVKQGEQNKSFRKTLPIQSALNATINEYLDLKIYNAQATEISYYVEACDNDAARGAKCSISEVYTYKLPTNATADSVVQAQQEAMMQQVSSMQSDQKNYQKQIEQLQNQLLQQSSQMDSWEQKKAVEQMKALQEKMKQELEAMQKRLQQQQQQAEKSQLSEGFQENQDEVKKQLDDMVKNDLQKQIDKMNQLLQQLNQNQPPSVEQMQQMQQENKMSKMSMERLEAMIKKLEKQLNIEQAAKKTEALLQKQTDLLDKTKAENANAKDLAKEQQKIEQELEQLKKEELNKIAHEDQNKDIQDVQEAADAASDAMDKSEDELQKDNKSGSQSKQQDAKQQLKKMQDKLSQMSGGGDMEQVEIDIKATRQLLTNLLRLSFDQEQLLQTVKKKQISTERIPELVAQQSKLARNAAMINDSLFSLSKRVMSISNAVNRETNALTQHISSASASLSEQNLYQTVISQQSAMTNANNLALLLNELLENLIQDQSQMEGSGSGSSKSKGKPKPGQSSGSTAGDQLKDIISKQQQMGQGKSPGGQQSGGQQGSGQQGQGQSQGQSQGQGQSGQSGQNGQSGQGQQGGEQGSEGGEYGNAEQLAKQAREQALIRQQMNQLNTILNSKGIKGNAAEIKAIQDMMNKNEADLVNRRVNSDFYKRQQQILQRMLQLEKAVREQEQDDKRQGKAPQVTERPIPPALKLEQQKFQKMVEQYKTIAPKLQPYYEQIGNEYLKRVQ